MLLSVMLELVVVRGGGGGAAAAAAAAPTGSMTAVYEKTGIMAPG